MNYMNIMTKNTTAQDSSAPKNVQKEAASRVARRASHSGWRDDEIDTLKRAIRSANLSGEPLRGVFERISHILGRKPNSVRNFYYAQLKELEEESGGRAAPFKTFKEDELREMLRFILVGMSQGMSVRACVGRLAGGDKSLMLRYQNKYRSLIRTRRDLVCQVMNELEESGVAIRDPFKGRGKESVVPVVEARARETTDPALRQLLNGLNALLSRPAAEEQLLTIERLQAKCDILVGDLNHYKSLYSNLRQTAVNVSEFLQMCAAADKQTDQGFVTDKIKLCVNALEEALAE